MVDESEECDCEEGAAWMATFADLMSLLLTFFVLLLSFANMDVVRFRVVLGSVKEALGVQFEHPGDKEAVSTSIIQMSKQESSPNLKIIDEVAMLKKVKKFIKDSGMEGLMEASLGERGVVIRIKGHILFTSGDASLRKEAPAALAPIVKLIQAMDNQMAIEGHTDDRPIQTTRFPSNWELSTARAVATMRYLVDKGGMAPTRVNVAGYADMRPISDNKTSEGRAKNRRVEFVFLRSPDKDPITTEEVEAARKEMERMRADESLLDDPGPVGDAGTGSDGGVLGALDAGAAVVEVSEEADAGEALPADAGPPPAPDATIVAPDISPKMKAEDVTPVGEASP